MKFLPIALTVLCIQYSAHDLKINTPDPTAKKKAYSIFKRKCNVCHNTDNPNKVFTMDNMDGFAKKIKRQVFLWRRMPKGNEIVLTEKEKQELKSWIKSL